MAEINNADTQSGAQQERERQSLLITATITDKSKPTTTPNLRAVLILLVTMPTHSSLRYDDPK